MDPFCSLVKLMDILRIVFFLMYKMKYIELQGNLYVEMHFKNVLKIRLVLYVLLY